MCHLFSTSCLHISESWTGWNLLKLFCCRVEILLTVSDWGCQKVGPMHQLEVSLACVILDKCLCFLFCYYHLWVLLFCRLWTGPRTHICTVQWSSLPLLHMQVAVILVLYLLVLCRVVGRLVCDHDNNWSLAYARLTESIHWPMSQHVPHCQHWSDSIYSFSGNPAFCAHLACRCEHRCKWLSVSECPGCAPQSEWMNGHNVSWLRHRTDRNVTAGISSWCWSHTEML